MTPQAMLQSTDGNPSGSAILGGIKVLDLTRVLAGPWCTQSLADLGATVYKIEKPGVGDEMRHSPPFLKEPDGSRSKESVPYLCVNRGKRSLTIDFTRPEGQEVVRQLALQCDVLVENFKVGDLKRFGLDQASLREQNPGLIYCSITGYGQDGPMASLPGYDPVFQAISGIMSTCGLPDGVPGGGPMRSMVSLVDVMTGMTATSAILAALFHRERTGQGQYIDMALLDVALASTAHLGQNYLATGKVPQRAGNGSLLFAPSGCFPCKEGHVFIQIGNDLQWRRLCEGMERPDWLADERFATNAQRMEHVPELNAVVSAMTSTFDKQVLADRLGVAGVPCGPVNTLAEAFDHPQVKHRGIRVEVEHETLGSVPLMRSPLRFSETPPQHKPAPRFGADTVTVLQDELELDDAAIDRLREASVL